VRELMTYRPLPWIIGGTAASVLFTEIVLTRLFSVLLFYHYSFLAVALALFGLAAGGLSAAWTEGSGDETALMKQLRELLHRAGLALLVLVLVLVIASPAANPIVIATGLALFSAVPLFMLGKALALSLAAGRASIHRLYAVDLIASAAAALAAIPLLALVQGPLVLAVPAVLALALALALTDRSRRLRPAMGVTAIAAVLVAAATSPGPLLPLRDQFTAPHVLERWNAHSRVLVLKYLAARKLIIDKSASTIVPATVAGADGMPAIDPAWAHRFSDPSYVLGRLTRRIGIIGVGGGPDLLPALAAGATRIDGFELNGRVLEILESGLDGLTSITRRPEIHLVHDEARHALQRSTARYDVLRANLVDTWAATASGGFVLAENGLYTLEGWRLFLARLTPSGVLVMTRWNLPGAPAEAERLVALAAEALEAEGIASPAANVVALSLPTNLQDSLAGGRVETITTLVSRQPFSAAEVDSVARYAATKGGTLLLAPGRTPPPESRDWGALLARDSRTRAIAASAWAIDPPTDERPFFFLQLRPRDVLRLSLTESGTVTRITLRGVQVLALASGAALAAALVLTWLASGRSRETVAPLSMAGRSYFALLGLGYMAVQLGLNQRLSIVLGHPTTTLALVIATMLLGTGVGSALAGVVAGRVPPAGVLAVPIAVVAVVSTGFDRVQQLGELPSRLGTAAGAGLLSGGVGLALGVALPTGLRVYTRSQATVAEAWTINGAFSVVGSVLAAVGGLVMGSRSLLTTAIPVYALAFLLVAVGQPGAALRWSRG
jgi:hypothetical protein